MKPNKYRVFLLLMILNVFFFGLHYFFEKNQSPSVIARNSLNSDAAIPSNNFQESNYELAPVWDKYFGEKYDIQNAYVSTNPDDSFKYKLNGYKERLDVFSGKIDYLTLAEKRILEIEKFGFKGFLLDKYVENIDSFVKNEKNSVSYVLLKNLIVSHQKRIDYYIYSLSDASDTKQTYQNKSDTTFSGLIKKIDKNIYPYDPQNLIYSTKDILTKKDFGSYSIFSDDIENIEELVTSEKLFLAPKQSSEINDMLFNKLLSSGKIDQKNELLKSNSVMVIPINANTKDIVVSYPTVNLISSGWELKTATKEGYFYTKKLDKPLKSLSKYYIKYYSRYGLLDTEKIGNKAMTLALVNDEISDIFIDKIIPNNLQKIFENVINTPDAEVAFLAKIAAEKVITATAKTKLDVSDELLRGPLLGGERGKPDEYSLTLFSTRELTKDELSNIGFEIYPYNDPSISLSKNEYLPWTNPINTEKPKQYFLLAVYFLSILLAAYLLWNLINKAVNLIWKLITIFCKKIRLIFLTLVIPAILFDIFILPQNYDTVTVLLTIFWVIVVIGYRLESRFSFAITLSFLIICPISLAFGNEFVAEKAAIWTYMFLVVGTVQSMIELKVGNKSRVDFDEFLKATEPLWKRFFALLKTTLNPIKNKIINFYTHIIYLFQKKRTIKESVIFFIKVFIIIIFSVAILALSTIAIKMTYDKFQFEYRKYQRNILNPRIKKIEPYYVYKATKVLMRGDLFGLKNNEKQRLMSDTGEVEYQFYDDSKIIFVMPTEWAFGEHIIWIEKNIGWDGKRVTARSNVVKIKLIPIGAKMTSDDEKYFEQLKSLDKETLEINGYK